MAQHDRSTLLAASTTEPAHPRGLWGENEPPSAARLRFEASPTRGGLDRATPAEKIACRTTNKSASAACPDPYERIPRTAWISIANRSRSTTESWDEGRSECLSGPTMRRNGLGCPSEAKHSPDRSEVNAAGQIPFVFCLHALRAVDQAACRGKKATRPDKVEPSNLLLVDQSVRGGGDCSPRGTHRPTGRLAIRQPRRS